MEALQVLKDEVVGAVYYVGLWLINNNYSFQMYSHAAKVAI